MRAVTAVAVAAAALIGAGAGGVSADTLGDLIRSKDVKDNSLTSRDIKNGTLQAEDFHSRAVRKLKEEDWARVLRMVRHKCTADDKTILGATCGPTDNGPPQGPTGPTGPQGPTGPPGPATH